MTNFLQDLRFALRSLWARPAFAIVAVATIGLGIGANTVMFSTVNAILLRPLPFSSAGRLVMIWEHHPAIAFDQIPVSPADLRDWRDQNTVFSDLIAMSLTSMNLTGKGMPQRVSAVAASTNAFSMLGARAIAGRTFGSKDSSANAPLVSVLSRKAAVRIFGTEDAALGRNIELDGKPYTVVGVMPEGFDFPPSFAFIGRLLHVNAEVWVPLKDADLGDSRDNRSLFVMARLKDGVDIAHAQQNMDAINSALSKQYPDTNEGITVHLIPLQEQVVHNARPALLALFGAVGFVLLIACANVANLLLARASGRHRELAIRTALGGTNWRLIRQLLTESVTLAAVGSAFGLLIASWGIDLLTRFGPQDIPRLGEVRLNIAALVFTFVVAGVTGILFGLAPALQARRIDLIVALKEGSRSTSGLGGQRLRGALVVLETALALVLLVGSGLLIQSLIHLQSIDPGFDTENLLTFTISLDASEYGSSGLQRNFFERVMEHIRNLPGVRSASMASGIPLTNSMSASSITAEGQPHPASNEDRGADTRLIGTGYFRTMGIPLREGREFSERDNAGASPVAIVNETMARRFWPGLSPIGRRVKIGDPGDSTPWLTIVGVVGDARNWSIDRPIQSELYTAFAQSPGPRMTGVVRSGSAPDRLTEMIRQQVAAIDPKQPVYAVQTLSKYLSDSFIAPRFRTLLSAMFASLAVFLAALGIYGVMSYFVSERIGEIGIRLALGAQKKQVMWMVLRQGMKLAGAGIAFGLILAMFLTRAVASLLFGIAPFEPITFLALGAVMALVAAAAIYIPARRAMGIDPIIALRYE